ncbi:MAG: hypothetical protein ACI358_00375 [Candidatus Limimorpha sp.]
MRKKLLFLTSALCLMMLSSCKIYEKMVFSSKDIVVSNECAGETGLDFKLVSLIGDKDEQIMTLSGWFINHDINKDIRVGKEFIAYDAEGNPHKGLNNINSYRALTDKKVRFSFEIPGQVVPKRNKVMRVIGFYIDECYIEIRNVPVIWKKSDDNNK